MKTPHTSPKSGSSTQESSTPTSVVQYEEVLAKHPITGEIQRVDIEKVAELTPEEHAAKVQAELEKFGLEPIEQVEVENPLTGKRQLITLDRTGTSEAKLMLALVDPNLTRDQKDHHLSMYLFERGKESTSFVVDIIRSKGQHTKETRIFKSQIRFDFEQFASQFCQYLEDQVKLASTVLGISVEDERRKFYAFVEERRQADKKLDPGALPKQYTYFDYFLYTNPTAPDNVGFNLGRLWSLQITNAMHAYESGQAIRARIRSITDAREREKGKGIYLDAHGKPYLQDDPQLDEALQKDRDNAAEAAKDQ